MSFFHDRHGLIQVLLASRNHQTIPEEQGTLIINSEVGGPSFYKFALHPHDVRVIPLHHLDVVVKFWFHDQVIHLSLRNNLEVHLSKLFIQRWLLHLNFQLTIVGFAAQGIGHHIRFSRGIGKSMLKSTIVSSHLCWRRFRSG